MSMTFDVGQNAALCKVNNTGTQQRASGAYWNDARTERLVHLWNVDKLSAAQCAAALNTEFPLEPPLTRNAVIGKAHRMGEALNARTKAFGQRPRPPRRPRLSAAVPHSAVPSGWSVHLKPARAKAEPFVVPVEQRKTFAQLERHHCRWPSEHDVGHPDFFFCGGDVDGHSYYCNRHAAVAVR